MDVRNNPISSTQQTPSNATGATKKSIGGLMGTINKIKAKIIQSKLVDLSKDTNDPPSSIHTAESSAIIHGEGKNQATWVKTLPSQIPPKTQVTKAQITEAASHPSPVSESLIPKKSNEKSLFSKVVPEITKTIDDIGKMQRGNIKKLRSEDTFDRTAKKTLKEITQGLENAKTPKEAVTLLNKATTAIETYLKERPKTEKRTHLEGLKTKLETHKKELEQPMTQDQALTMINSKEPKDLKNIFFSQGSPNIGLAAQLFSSKNIPQATKNKLHQALTELKSENGSDATVKELMKQLGPEAKSFIKDRLSLIFQEMQGELDKADNKTEKLKSQEGTFLRSDSIDSKILAQYFRKELATTTAKVLNQNAHHVNDQAAKLQVVKMSNGKKEEGIRVGDYIDLAQDASDEDIKVKNNNFAVAKDTNRDLLTQLIQELIANEKSLEEIQDLMKDFHSKISQYFGNEEIADKQALSNLFLRFFCPALTSPEGILEVKAFKGNIKANALLTWIAKLTQFAANQSGEQSAKIDEDTQAFIQELTPLVMLVSAHFLPAKKTT